MLYDLMPTMTEDRLGPLLARYEELINEQRTFSGVFEAV